MNRLTVSTFVFVALVLGALAYFWQQPQKENDIEKNLDIILHGQNRNAAFLALDLICFGQYTTNLQNEFAEASNLAEPSFSESLQNCGIHHSCCPSDSNLSGIIGLVSQGKIECVPITQFDYWLHGNKPFCASPRNINVEIEDGTLATRLPSKPNFSPSRRSYRISERID